MIAIPMESRTYLPPAPIRGERLDRLRQMLSHLAAELPIDERCVVYVMRRLGCDRRAAQRALNEWAVTIQTGYTPGDLTVMFSAGFGPAAVVAWFCRESPAVKETRGARAERRRGGRGRYDRMIERKPGAIARAAYLRSYLRSVGAGDVHVLAASNAFGVMAGSPRGSTSVIGRAVRRATEELAGILENRGCR